jgi:hypothetical protein
LVNPDGHKLVAQHFENFGIGKSRLTVEHAIVSRTA